MNKKVLLVFHNNFLNNDVGCNSYIFQIAKYLKSKNCKIHLFSCTNIWNNFETFEALNRSLNLVDELHLYAPKPDPSSTARQYKIIHNPDCTISAFGKHILTISSTTYEITEGFASYFGWIQRDTVEFFQKLITENNYDSINVHYLQMAELFRFAKAPKHTKLIYSAQDALYMMDGYLSGGIPRMLDVLPKEIEIMSYFDEILCISNDEKNFFQRLMPDKIFRHYPHALNPRNLPEAEKDIDVLFLGFMNPHNRDGLIWFIDLVLPILKTKPTIVVCGKVWLSLEKEAPQYVERALLSGVQRVDFSEDLDFLFARTRLTICPLRSGTGMKIKTIDSLARGIPVVSTSWGVDGFADKNNNGCLVADSPTEFAQRIHLLLDDDSSYKHYSAQAREYFKKYLSLEANSATLDLAFEL
jgi:glycosyltransferase involved in cell wall biosynthesis